MFRSIKNPNENRLEINKSVFICTLFRCMDRFEALSKIEQIKQRFPDATHHCFAFLTFTSEGMDDDGEPLGTAGLPMLSILKKNGLMGVGAVVTRYYGGIKLGAGGLIRAYSKAVSETLKQTPIVFYQRMTCYKIVFDYPLLKAIEHEIRYYRLDLTKKEFNESIIFYFRSDNEQIKEDLKAKYQNELDIFTLNDEFVEMDGTKNV